ncbi:MAG: alpha-amylase family glycosyl hydrolase [Coleofasciculus sp. G3-WIS-01]|uniref:alpha-amylase family glycosyl hydrolase n=1 Tax=Coleofasciculus sp. G3-WIS-01 TaxID=3069528 RepID=UPI0032F1D3D4
MNAIWFCPLFESPMDDFGYDVTDMYTIDPDLGTLEDFDQLLADAHNSGFTADRQGDTISPEEPVKPQ